MLKAGLHNKVKPTREETSYPVVIAQPITATLKPPTTSKYQALAGGGGKVESVYKLMNTGRMLKIRFSTTEMAERAVREGLVVVYQKIAPRHVEKEIFIKLNPCYNCYGYDHKTQSCEKEKQTICTSCTLKGHNQGNCTETSPKCINCNGKQKTLASICPVRKGLIKERGEEVRECSRSRLRARQVTYADTVIPRQQQQQ